MRLVFDRLAAVGSPSVTERDAIYAQCRKEVAASLPDELLRAAALQELEKVIRRQELQALYEESLDDR